VQGQKGAQGTRSCRGDCVVCEGAWCVHSVWIGVTWLWWGVTPKRCNSLVLLQNSRNRGIQHLGAHLSNIG
jgi:hypothetical protein